MNQDAREGVEDPHGVRGCSVRQDKEAAGGGGDEVVVAEERQLPAEEAASVGVDEEADAIAAGEHVHAAGEEAGVGGGLVFISSHEAGQHYPVAVGRAGGGLEFIQHDPPGGVEARVMRVAAGVGGGGAPVVADVTPGRWWRGDSRRRS